MLAGALGAGIGGIGTQLFITESFHRDKAQAEAHDKFREAYWQNRAQDNIGSCKNPSY